MQPFKILGCSRRGLWYASLPLCSGGWTSDRAGVFGADHVRQSFLTSQPTGDSRQKASDVQQIRKSRAHKIWQNKGRQIQGEAGQGQFEGLTYLRLRPVGDWGRSISGVIEEEAFGTRASNSFLTDGRRIGLVILRRPLRPAL